jgi:hypothetical protein
MREYMHARTVARTGRRPIRRIKEHSPTAPARGHYATEDWQRRIEYRERVGLFPERLRGLDDAALVAAMRDERRRHG